MVSHKWRRFEIGLVQPIIHGLLSDGSTKSSSNISLDKLSTLDGNLQGLPLSQHSPVHAWHHEDLSKALFMNCSFLCFPSNGTSHFMYKASLSSILRRTVNLFARNSLSRFNALRLHVDVINKWHNN